MSTTVSPRSSALPRRAQRPTASNADRIKARRLRPADPEPRALAHYTSADGRVREVIARPAFAGSVLIIDRDYDTLGDRRLVAHLAADEPDVNGVLVCESYLDQVLCGGGRCRTVTADDYRATPLSEETDEGLAGSTDITGEDPVDGLGRTYTISPVWTGMSIPELRWHQQPEAGSSALGRAVSVREAIACLESYEPVRTLTRRTLAPDSPHAEISTTVLRAELERVLRSPIVLNRGLREVTLRMIDRHQLSLSEIATRCGRVKRDSSGNESGETSWLARRLGILPEGGKDTPTPWIHTDVLALIARRGLGIGPREVELD